MRNMSFMLTTRQILLQTKTVTRRFGWWFIKPGDIVRPVRQAMGLQKGETVQKLGCPIRFVDARPVSSLTISPEDLVLEGFDVTTDPAWFRDLLIESAGPKWRPTVNRLQFEYTEPL